jgi:hypothetical protein
LYVLVLSRENKVEKGRREKKREIKYKSQNDWRKERRKKPGEEK